MHFGTVQEFQGLNFTTNVNAQSKIAAVVGRNGSGKSRLLKAIAERRIEVFVEGATVQPGACRLLTSNDLSPGLGFSFDAFQHRELQRQAVASYNEHRGKFDTDPQRIISALANHQLGRRGISISQLAYTVSRAAKALGKDPNELRNTDIEDFFAVGDHMVIGSLNVVGIVRAYVARAEQNSLNEFRNHRYGEQNPFWTPQQFVDRFGPPPWELLNRVLDTVLDGRYQFEVPEISNIAGYSGRLIRLEDGLAVEPSWLSSGEKVLMWLCLSMYATTSGTALETPKLLLLDEPDASLHPKMVQKLHAVLAQIVESFGCGIIFTTHSPTTVALFNAGPIWQVSERSIVEVEKDAAISDLLVGLDQIAIHYTKCKQVYVESHKDEDVYTELFSYLRRWNLGVSKHIALSFIPAAPKLAPDNVRKVMRAYLGELDSDKVEAFIQALNGQGDCVNVEGTVASLNADGGTPVHGIIDWDLSNRPHDRIQVLGEGIFYNLENAVLNPLALGIYLLQNFRDKLNLLDFGLNEAFDLVEVYSDNSRWQTIADGVTAKVLNDSKVNHEVDCIFLAGGRVFLDRRYAHMNGHSLENRLREADVYPFLKALSKRPTLLMDVIRKVVQPTQGRMMPMEFVRLFADIQSAA